MSQCQRVLDVLKDGRTHTMQEIHQRAGFMRLNSRVSELRSRGYNIVCDKTGGVYRYRLLGGPSRAGGLSDLRSPQSETRLGSPNPKVQAATEAAMGPAGPSLLAPSRSACPPKGGSGATSPPLRPAQLTIEAA